MFDDDTLDRLNEENSMTVVDKAKMDIMKMVKKQVDEAIDNLDYVLHSEFELNLNTISRFVSKLLEVQNIGDDKGLTDDEKIAKVKEIEFSVRELSFDDLDEEDSSVEESDDEEDSEIDLDEFEV